MSQSFRLTEAQIKAVVLGHAVADALGVPVEFTTRESRMLRPVTDMQGYGTYNVPAGTWSDDTAMSLCALDVLADGICDYDRIMQNFARWYQNADYTATNELFDIGGACSSAIQRYLNQHLPATSCGVSGPHADGNGSLMRIHPFVLALLTEGDHITADGMDIIFTASSLTHANFCSKIGCGIYALVLAALLRTPALPSVSDALSEAVAFFGTEPEFKAYSRLCEPHFAELPIDQIKSSGYVVDTLEAAVWCLLTTDSYRACVLKAVNLGSDTDTVAAVAGGLAGALYGLDAIPDAWLQTLKKRDMIESMCERLAAL